MNDFLKYMEMGMHHILNWGALDHLLFIGSLVIGYTLYRWQKVLLLLTAFTIGHAISMLIVMSDLIDIPTRYIEFAIPLTILITAVWHLFGKRDPGKIFYYLALVFGLIHGMAFAQTFEAMFGFSKGFLVSALGFNLGVEVAQLLSGFLLMAIAALITRIFDVSREKVRVFIFAVIITLAFQYLWQNRLW